MKTIEFEGKTLIVNPGCDCEGCYFDEYGIECPVLKSKGAIYELCMISDCNFTLQTYEDQI